MTQINIIGPKEVEERNIITQSELRVMVEALDEFVTPGLDLRPSRRKLTLARSAKHKIQVLKQMGGAHAG